VGTDQPGSQDEDFHLGAAVHASDGTEIGTLSRLIVGKDDLTLKAFVVRENRRFSGHFPDTCSPPDPGCSPTR